MKLMHAVPFDILKLARDLEAAGLAPPVAAGSASALADALISADLATKSDLAAMGTRLEARIGSSETNFDLKITSLQSRLEAKIELLRRDMTIKLGGMIFVAVGVLLAAMRLMPHP
jgi:hypothetical protein